VDGYVYFGSKDGKFYCLNASTKDERWDPVSTGDIVYDSPAVSEKGYVYFASLDGKVYCLDASTGVEAWNFNTGYDVHSSPAVTRKFVYIGSSDGNVYCLDAKMGAGEPIWHYKTGGSIFSSPAVAHGLVYVGSYDNNMYCLRAPDDEDSAWPMFRGNPQRTGVSDSSCFAQKLLGGHDANLATLRLFRDQVLAKSSLGKRFIALYYAYGDRLGELCGKYPAAQSVAKCLLKACVPAVALLVQN
jgi:glucose dehydrogenase